MTIERIYIGGLDPSRGLTVEIVVSKLKTVSGVEILSINDVPITQTTTTKNDDTQHQKHYFPTIGGGGRIVVDDNGDIIVDTRNFFYLEARRVIIVDNNETNTAYSSDVVATTTTSALELLAKQYNGVKWMGCNIRVEPARPHFLQRLEEERALCVYSIPPVEMKKKKEDEEGVDIKDVVAIINNRRRLRIRKAYGEEAYHVDTHPHVIEINNPNYHHHNNTNNNNNNDLGGWDTFATLHKRLHDKYHSQYMKMIELRKKERRLWATSSGVGGGGKGKNNHNLEENYVPSSNDNVGSLENNDEGRLRSLIFLNRAIHIRFSSSSSSNTNDDVAFVVNDTKNIRDSLSVDEESASITSSSAVSSTSYESDNEESRSGGERRRYVWSDDDSDDGTDYIYDTIVDRSHNRSIAVTSNDERTGIEDTKYNRRDDEYTSSNNDNDGQFLVKRKKMINESEYTRVATIDEFMGGMDFDISSNNSEGDVNSYNEDDANDDVDDDDNSSTHICLDEDIRSNMDVLSQLFPDTQFNNRPLAPSTIDGDGNDDNSNNNNDKRSKPSSSVFGAGLIVQRYDPTKETEQMLEMKTDLLGEENVDTDNDHRQENALLSNKHLDDAHTMEEQTTKIEEQTTKMEESDEQSDIRDLIDVNVDDKKSRVLTNTVGKVVPAKDVYEQDKLEEIFKQSRGGQYDSFSFGSLFQIEEKLEVDNEQEIYEQYKLEQVFKLSRGGDNRGFSFGFNNEQTNNMTVARDGSSAKFSHETTSEKEDFAVIEPSSEIQERQSINLLGRKTFSKVELDEYEKLFFSLNEGPQILSDLDGMKNNEENQDRWQNERAVLTADWKRKQKSVLSKKGKKKSRRF
jgi:hypothetical protein